MYALSDVDQLEAHRHWQAAQERCERCGNPRSRCSDPTVQWSSNRSICFATMEREAAQAAFDAQHGDKSEHRWHNGSMSAWSPERTLTHPVPYNAGVTVFVAEQDFDPGDNFVSEPTARPAVLRPSAGDPASDNEGVG